MANHFNSQECDLKTEEQVKDEIFQLENQHNLQALSNQHYSTSTFLRLVCQQVMPFTKPFLMNENNGQHLEKTLNCLITR